MRRIYRNPPLIEALCEFQFKSEQPWDWTVPGRVYERINHDFPIRKEQNILEVELHATGTEIRPNVKGGVARMLFLRKDESALVQVGPDILVVNCLRPYPHWENFRSMIHRAFSEYARVAQPAHIHRIGLRYINRIEIPNFYEANLYVRYLPQIPEELFSGISSWIQQVEINLEGHDVLRIQSGTLVESGSDHKAILFDIELSTREVTENQLAGWEDWLEKAHAKIEEVFESFITDRARQSFGVEESNE